MLRLAQLTVLLLLLTQIIHTDGYIRYSPKIPAKIGTPLKIRLHSSPKLQQPEPSLSFPVSSFALVYLALPIASITLLNPSLSCIIENVNTLLLLLISKRIYLYALALTALDITSKQFIQSAPDFGSRFLKVNEDLLGVSLTAEAKNAADEMGLSASFNSTSETSQAIALPVLLAVGLGLSYVTIIAGRSLLSSSSSSLLDPATSNLLPLLLPFITSFPSAAVSFLFTRSSLNSVLPAFASSPV